MTNDSIPQDHKPHSRLDFGTTPTGEQAIAAFKAWALAGSDPHSDWNIERRTARSLFEQLEALDDALRDILDVTEKWTRPMTDEERLLRIDTIAKAALPKASSPARGPSDV